MEFELTYFPTKGRAEFIRLIFAAVGQDFKDTRIGGETWEEFKSKTPMEAMPVLTVKGGEKDRMICQTNTIAIYLAKKFGLYGSNTMEDTLINEFVESLKDTMNVLVKWFTEKDEEKKAEHLKEFADVTVPQFAKYFKSRKNNEGRNGFIIGSKMSIADLNLFAFIDQIKPIPGLTAFDNYPEIEEHYNLIKSNPNIKKWQADHEETK